MPSCIIDSETSHHIASDLNNISMHTPYNINDNMMICNGACLPITHTGSVSLPSISHNLHLQNVLCEPMKNNLTSVKQFMQINSFMFNFVMVKHLHMRTTFLKSKANKRMYVWPLLFASAFFSIKCSPLEFHLRLGHPNSKSLSHMLPLVFFTYFLCFIFSIVLQFML